MCSDWVHPDNLIFLVNCAILLTIAITNGKSKIHHIHSPRDYA